MSVASRYVRAQAIFRRIASRPLFTLLLAAGSLAAVAEESTTVPLAEGANLLAAAPEAIPSSSSVVDDLSTNRFSAAAAAHISSAAAARNSRDVDAYPSIGVSYGQTVGNLRLYSFAQDRSAELPTILYLHPSGHFLWLRFDYMVQEIPVYILHEPKYFNYDSVPLSTQHRAVFGTGIFPAGERMILNPHSKLQVSLYSNGGFTYFTRRILSEGGARFNIGLQFGVNFQYPLTHNSSVIAGYAENHLSNSNTNLKNPGLDMNLFFVQYVIHLHKKS